MTEMGGRESGPVRLFYLPLHLTRTLGAPSPRCVPKVCAALGVAVVTRGNVA